MSAIGNFFSWLIGSLIMTLWAYLGAFLGIFGNWQSGLDNVLSTMENFSFEAMTVPTGDLTYTV